MIKGEYLEGFVLLHCLLTYMREIVASDVNSFYTIGMSGSV